MFSKMAVIFYAHTSNAWGFQFLPIFIYICDCLIFYYRHTSFYCLCFISLHKCYVFYKLRARTSSSKKVALFIAITAMVCSISKVCLYNHSSRYVEVSHCGFNLIYLMTNDIEHLFLCLLVIHNFHRTVYARLIPFLNWVFSLIYYCCKSSLYIMDNTSFILICKHFLSVFELSFYSLNAIFWSSKTFN